VFSGPLLLMLQFDLGCLATNGLDFCLFQQQVPARAAVETSAARVMRVDSETEENDFKTYI